MAKELGRSLMGSFQRVKQSAEEKLGKSEKTEWDAQFEQLMARTDRIKHETEQLLKDMAAYLQPNPTRRLENTVYKKLNRKAKERLSEPEVLAETMLNASASLGAQTPYGQALTEVAKGQKRIGEAWSTLQESIDEYFVRPHRLFLESEIKQAAAERKTLNKCRLDLDAARARARRATQQDKMLSAEQEVATAQTKFDQQYEVTKLMLQNVQRRNEEGVNRLLAFVNAQRQFFSGSAEIAAELATTLRGILNVGEDYAQPQAAAAAAEPSGPKTMFVRVLCDYDAADSSELSLVADEMISVHKDRTLPSGWVMGTRNGISGKVATSYLDVDPNF